MAGGSSELMEWAGIGLMRLVGVSRKVVIVHGLLSIKSLLVRFMLVIRFVLVMSQKGLFFVSFALKMDFYYIGLPCFHLCKTTHR
jgi:hypothetical protein